MTDHPHPTSPAGPRTQTTVNEPDDGTVLDVVLAAFFDATDLYTRTVLAQPGPMRDRSGVSLRTTVDPRALLASGPPGTGCADPGSSAYLVASLLACQATTYRLWAIRLNVEIVDLSIELAGQLDLAALLDAGPNISASLGGVRIRICIEGPEHPARYLELHAAVMADAMVRDLPRTVGPNQTAQVLRVIPGSRRAETGAISDFPDTAVEAR